MHNGPYELIIAPEKYPGKRYRGRYAYEHHVVYWKHRRRVPKLGEVVHHINGNKRDNRIRNLELKSRAEHSKNHGTTGRTITILECFSCRFKFKRFSNQVKKNQNRNFCSRKCLYLAQIKLKGGSDEPRYD